MPVTFSAPSSTVNTGESAPTAVQRMKLNTREYGASQPQQTPEPPAPLQPKTGEAPATEEPKPMSPQLAELARQRRALQAKERELKAKEEALAGSAKDTVSLADLKSKPLEVLLQNGVTYDQIVEAALANPTDPKFEELRKELKAVTDRLDQQGTDQKTKEHQQVLQDLSREARQLAASPEYELVRVTDSIPDVVKLIEEWHGKTGEVLDVKTAMEWVEEDLTEETLKVAQADKIRQRLAPQQPAKPGMRTLTSKETSSSRLSARQRAINAFYNSNG